MNAPHTPATGMPAWAAAAIAAHHAARRTQAQEEAEREGLERQAGRRLALDRFQEGFAAVGIEATGSLTCEGDERDWTKYRIHIDGYIFGARGGAGRVAGVILYTHCATCGTDSEAQATNPAALGALLLAGWPCPTCGERCTPPEPTPAGEQDGG